MPHETTGSIADVEVLPVRAHADDRGALSEIYRRSWVSGGDEVLQANLSESRAGVLRGLHWHRAQRDYWCFASGRAFAAFVDLRRGSPTQGRSMTVSIDAAEERTAIALPAGVAHGFLALSDVMLLYLVDAYYTGTDEFGLAWDDPDVAIAWPLDSAPILSSRDRSNPSLSEVLRDAPSYP